MFFAGGEKAIEGQRVFANVGVDKQCHFSVEFAERSVRGERNGDDVADTSDIHENLIRPFVSEPAAKLSNHRSPVLPLFFRPSTQGWGQRAAGATPSPAHHFSDADGSHRAPGISPTIRPCPSRG